MEHKQIFRKVFFFFSPLCSPLAVCLIKELHLFFLKLSQLLTSVFFFFLFSSYSPFVVIMKEERRTELSHLLSPDPAYFWCFPEIRLLNSVVSLMLPIFGEHCFAVEQRVIWTQSCPAGPSQVGNWVVELLLPLSPLAGLCSALLCSRLWTQVPCAVRSWRAVEEGSTELPHRVPLPAAFLIRGWIWQAPATIQRVSVALPVFEKQACGWLPQSVLSLLTKWLQISR